MVAEEELVIRKEDEPNILSNLGMEDGRTPTSARINWAEEVDRGPYLAIFSIIPPSKSQELRC